MCSLSKIFSKKRIKKLMDLLLAIGLFAYFILVPIYLEKIWGERGLLAGVISYLILLALFMGLHPRGKEFLDDDNNSYRARSSYKSRSR